MQENNTPAIGTTTLRSKEELAAIASLFDGIKKHFPKHQGGQDASSSQLPSASKQPPTKLEYAYPPDAPLFRHLRVPKLNIAPPKPVKVAPWKFDKATFGQDYCPESRVEPVDANEKKRNCAEDDATSPPSPSVHRYPTHDPYIGCGLGFGPHTSKEDVAHLVAFANEWIPRIKRMKTEDYKRGNDSDHGEDWELSKPKVNSGNEELDDKQDNRNDIGV